jgi:hypothetical protein
VANRLSGEYVKKMSLEEARTDPSCSNTTIIVTSSLSQEQSNILGTWPNDRGLEFRFGARLNNTSTFTFSDGRVFNSWRGYVFSGTGAIKGLRESYPDWFKDNTYPGVTDMATAFRSAISSSNIVLLDNTNYAIGSTISLSNGNKTIAGIDGGSQAFQHATIIHIPSSTGPVFFVGGNENGGVTLKNFDIKGGNGSFAIISERPYVRYEYIHMEPYNGGGIQFKSTGGGSSSSTVNNCQWVGPNHASNYTGYEVDINGGDVSFHRVTAIRGAIGFNILKGQTIILDQVSVTKQSRYFGQSSASQFDTAGIKLSGTGYKQSVTIRNSYIETCDNGIYAESAGSLSITDNWIDDGGAAGTVGSWKIYGNSSIFLKDRNVTNVTIMNNNILANSASDLNDLAHNFFALRINDATNVFLFNNIISTLGDNSAAYYITTSTSVFMLGNTFLPSKSFPAENYDPNHLKINLDKSKGSSNYSVSSISLTSKWVDVVPVEPKQVWKVYISDYNTAGNLQTEATVQIDASSASSVNYQVKFQAGNKYFGEVQVHGGKIQVRSSSKTFGAMYSVQRIQ